jgi:oligosaccharide repeat unit polymerase
MNAAWSLERKGLTRMGLVALATGSLLLMLLLGATSGRRPLHSILWIECCLLTVPLAWLLLKAVQQWTVTHDLLAPLVALPVAYILWFTLGSIDWIEVPSIWLFGLFDPIPARMWFFYSLGLMGFGGGVLLARRGHSSLGVATGSWNRVRFRITLTILFVTMVSTWMILIAQFGIPGAASNASEARLNVRGPFYFLFVSSAWTFFLFLPLHGWLVKDGRSRRFLTGGLLSLTAILLASLAGRSNIFVPLLTLIIVRHYANKRLDLRIAVSVALVAFLGLSMFGYLRDTAESDRSLQWMVAAGIPPPFVPAATAAVYVRYSIATFRDVTEMMPSHVPYQHGALTLAPFKTFLPGHQEMSDIFFRNMLGNDFIGVGEPATLLGPLYGDFGSAGVFLGMFAYGWFLAFLYYRMRKNPEPFRILLYAWVLQSGLFGLFATIFPYITTLLLPLFWFGLDRFLREPAVANENG